MVCIKEFFKKILASKTAVSTGPKKDLVIALPCLCKLSLQICTRINHIIKNKLPYYNICFFSTPSSKLVTLVHWKTKFHCSYVLVLFTKFSVMAAMLPIMAKTKLLLRSECVNTWEFWHSLGDDDLPLNNIFYFAITHLILKISQFSLPTTTTLKLTTIEITLLWIRTSNLYPWNFLSLGTKFHHMISLETDSFFCSSLF